MRSLEGFESMRAVRGKFGLIYDTNRPDDLGGHLQDTTGVAWTHTDSFGPGFTWLSMLTPDMAATFISGRSFNKHAMVSTLVDVAATGVEEAYLKALSGGLWSLYGTHQVVEREREALPVETAELGGFGPFPSLVDSP